MEMGVVEVAGLGGGFDRQRVGGLEALLDKQQHFLPGLEWIEGRRAREIEPLLPQTVQGALLSPYESNVQAARITLAYAQGAVSHGAHLIEGRPVGRLSCQGQRVVGVETTQGPMHGEIVVLAAGAWTSQWHTKASIPPIFPAKGQMMALQAPPGFHLRHTIYAYGVGCIVPKSD